MPLVNPFQRLNNAIASHKDWSAIQADIEQKRQQELHRLNELTEQYADVALLEQVNDPVSAAESQALIQSIESSKKKIEELELAATAAQSATAKSDKRRVDEQHRKAVGFMKTLLKEYAAACASADKTFQTAGRHFEKLSAKKQELAEQLKLIQTIPHSSTILSELIDRPMKNYTRALQSVMPHNQGGFDRRDDERFLLEETSPSLEELTPYFKEVD